MSWTTRTFRFFASLKLAVALLIILGTVFAAGTFIESYHGTPAAQVLVYRTPWLSFLLVLLTLNLLASALDRLPWKKKHIGFVTTHLGIILMLAGALITQAFAIEGQVQIEEGKSESRMSVQKPLLQVLSVDSGKRWTFHLKPHVFTWTGRQELKANKPASFKLNLLADYPKAKVVERVAKNAIGSPAIHVLLAGSMASSDEWLFLDDPERSTVHLGPAIIRFTRDPIKAETKTKEKRSGFGVIKFHFEDGVEGAVALEAKSEGQTYKLDKTPYQVMIYKVFKDAIVNNNELVDKSGEWNNPAVQLTLEGNGLSEKHTVFAKFPEFPTLHGMKPSEAHVRIIYEFQGLAASQDQDMSKNEIRFIYQEKGLPKYQVKRSEAIKEGLVEAGKSVETGWMDFKFTVDSYLDHASSEEQFEPLPSGSQNAEAISALHIEMEKGGERQTFWIPEGGVVHAQTEDSEYHLVYDLETYPLGFQIELKDFMMDTDPGTDRPASFKSAVVLKDAARGIKREQIIQMNEPLKHRGFKVYQSAYHVEEGRPDISIFTVARDPGNPLKYIGAIVMVGGILMLFYTKQFSTLKASDPRLRSK